MNNKNLIHTFSVLSYKESKYLDECLNSVCNQKLPCKVIIATTTPNQYITSLANKYQVEIITGKHTNIGGDFDFARNSANTELVTIAHQDDIYDYTFSDEVTKAYIKFPDASIIFPDYYEIRNGKKDYNNKNLKIKKFLLRRLKNQEQGDRQRIKRSALKYGDAISCPSVTFVKKAIPVNLFESNYKANIDWFAWEKLSKMDGRFVYINKPLMGHRISEETETTKIINAGIRTKEDYEIFKKFWPAPIAKIFARAYKESEKSNKT